MLKIAKEFNSNHLMLELKKHVLKKPNPSSSHMICPPTPPSRFNCCHAHSTLPRLVMSQGTSDSSSGGRGELPGQTGAGHNQTAERGGQCSAGAGQENHQAAPAAAAATSGKEGHRVPSWQAGLAQLLWGRSQVTWRLGRFPGLFSLCITETSCRPFQDHVVCHT